MKTKAFDYFLQEALQGDYFGDTVAISNKLGYLILETSYGQEEVARIVLHKDGTWSSSISDNFIGE